MSKSQFDPIKLHRKCVMSWRHHGCAKKDVVEPPPRYCGACEKLLVRRENEQLAAWQKRRSCDKACAAAGKNFKKVSIPKPTTDDARRLGCVSYAPGTVEFEKIAALYR